MIKRRDEKKMLFCLCKVSWWNGGNRSSKAQCIWAAVTEVSQRPAVLKWNFRVPVQCAVVADLFVN